MIIQVLIMGGRSLGLGFGIDDLYMKCTCNKARLLGRGYGRIIFTCTYREAEH